MENVINRPSIDENGICFTDDNVKINRCTVSDNGNITGFTDDNVKSVYNSLDNTWYFGKDIGKINLVSLKDRTEKERKEIVSKAHEKARENREKQKNINELAKAMLELTLNDRQIKAVMGDDTNILPDDTVASVMVGAMIKSAMAGSFKAFEAVRDTAGYRPKDMLQVEADIMSDADRSLIDKALKSG